MLSILKNLHLRTLPDSFRKLRTGFKLVNDLPTYIYSNYQKKIQIHKEPALFASLAEEVCTERKTFLKQDRLYTLFQLINQLPTDSIIVEVGVYKGGSVKFMSKLLLALKKESTIFACDTFTGHSIVDERFDGEHRINSIFSDVNILDVSNYLKNCNNVKIIAGDIHTTYSKIPTTKKLGLLHLDVDVYPTTKFCLNTLGPNVAKDGFIICDDYGYNTCKGVKKAVDDFCDTNEEWKKLHLLTGQVVLFKS